MIAYNKNWLENLIVHRKLDEALANEWITTEETNASKTDYPVGFYMPNFFIRIGLFFLTTIIAAFALGFCALLFARGGEKVIGTIVMFCGLMLFVALEIAIRRQYYRSGVDDALLWIGAILIVSGLNLMFDISSLGNSFLIFLIASVCVLRYIDAGMSVVAALSLIEVEFYLVTKMGDAGKAVAPFLVMALAALIYFVQKQIRAAYQYRVYANCLLLVEITCLLVFYAAANYFIVRELSITMFGLRLSDVDPLPLGSLFWGLTFGIPAAYIFFGIRRKDIVMLRTGLVLAAATIVTFRYYHQILPIEYALLTGGALIIVVAVALIKYLTMPKLGFTSEEAKTAASPGKLQLESLVVAEIAQVVVQPAPPHTEFGGGSGGGGGAGGDF